MKNRNLDHKDNWATPKEFYDKLNNEFNFDFDPCPLNHDIDEWDGLKIEWGDIYYINNLKWKLLNAPNVENINHPNLLLKEMIENVDIHHIVKNVNQVINLKNLELKQENDIYHLRNTTYYPIICQDAQDVILLNHLTKIIFLKTKGQKQDLVPIVKYAKEKNLDLLCKENGLIMKLMKLLNNKNINIEIQKRDEKDIESEVLLEIKNIEQNYLTGQNLTGINVKYFLETNVPIVDVKSFLLKTILYQYLMMIVQEQYQKILSLHVESVIHQKELNLRMIGVVLNQLNELPIISDIWMKLNNISHVFINPPYSDKKATGYLKTSFVKKAIEESKKGKLCVLLLPVSTSTKLFHNHILPNITEPIRFIKGRLKFSGVNTKGEYVENKPGMHDSMIVIFDGRGEALKNRLLSD